MNDRLYRSRDERVVAGVAGGLADYFGMDPSLVRVLWVLLAVLSGGAFILIYIVMAFVVPEEPVEIGSEAGAAAAAAAAGGPGPATTAPDWRALRAQERARRRAARAAARLEGGSMRGERGPIVFGLILIVLGGWFLVREYLPWLDIDRIWPLLLIGLGVIVLAGALRRDSGGTGTTSGSGPASPAA